MPLYFCMVLINKSTHMDPHKASSKVSVLFVDEHGMLSENTFTLCGVRIFSAVYSQAGSGDMFL